MNFYELSKFLHPKPTDLLTMKNIDPEIKRKLINVDIQSAEMLIQLGCKKAFFRLKMLNPQLDVSYLYALARSSRKCRF